MAQKIIFPIGVKLVTIIIVLLLLSLGAITALVSYFVSADVQITAEDNNNTINRRSSREAASELETVRSSVFLLMDMISTESNSPTNASGVERISRYFFDRNPSIAAVIVYGQDEYINEPFFTKNEINVELVRGYVMSLAEYIEDAKNGSEIVLNAAPVFGQGILSFVCRRDIAPNMPPVIALFSSEMLSESFSSGANSTFMINRDGDVLIHADFELVKSGANWRENPLVKELWESGAQGMQSARQRLVTNSDGVRYFIAYSLISTGNVYIITGIEYDTVFEGVTATTRRNIFLTGAVLFAAIILVLFFSMTLSTPIKALAEAAQEIGQGKYEVHLKKTTRDEIGFLTDSFVRMGQGLAERERLKDTFGRFINKTIAEKAMKGELTLGGETKPVTIFFSDIRSFTAISEKLPPNEVVTFLNEYMTAMVNCVNATRGVVDKFIGDAIMAVWGAPLSSGSAAQDAFNGVVAALMMRHALIEFNRGRGGDKKPVIKIGCGINTGNVVAGQIGSTTRMEYTIIGDAVNLASRTESLNKPLGTDILITENTYRLIKDYVLVEKMPSVTVKGKEKPVKMFAVVNIPGAKNIPGAGVRGPKSLKEVRVMLGIPEPDFSKVDVDADEKKYKIGTGK